MINPDRLTVKSTEALNGALSLARRNGNPLVYDLHLLSALLQQAEGIVVPILQKLGVGVPALREALEREVARYPKQSDAQPNLSRELSAVLDAAEKEAPLAVVFGHYLASGEPSWKLISFGFIFLYLTVELLVDFVFKVEFRKKLIPHALYIILFYSAIIGFIRMSFAVNTNWGYAVSVAFWILLGALIYNLTGQRKAKRQQSS